jgi:hypothetical protein
MDKQQLLKRLQKEWTAFRSSFRDLSESDLLRPGVTGMWSIKDIVAHVTTWEEEALKNLPVVLRGGRPPRYSTTYGGIDQFNAQMTERKRNLALSEVLEQLDTVHERLLGYIFEVPETQFTQETRFRRRLRLDTYSHYPRHARAIVRWRQAKTFSRD